MGPLTRFLALIGCMSVLLVLPPVLIAEEGQDPAASQEQVEDTAEEAAPDSSRSPVTITTTAERSVVELENLPRSVEVVTREDLQEELARSVPEALHETAGVSVQRTNQGGGSPFIRGMKGNQILLMVDGIRINNSTIRSGPVQYLNTVDPLALERIEVVRGVGSVLYGSDALGGTINLVTRRRRRFEERFGIAGALLGRTTTAEDEESGSVYASTNIGETVGFAATYSHRSFGDVDQGGDLPALDQGYTQKSFTGNLDFHVSDNVTIQFGGQYDFATDVTLLNLNESFDPQARNLFYSKVLVEDVAPGLDVVEVVCAMHQQRETRQIEQTDAITTGTDEVDTIHAGLKVESAVTDGLRFVYGADYYGDDIGSERYTQDLTTGAISFQDPNLADDSSYGSYAGYFQVQWNPVEWLRLVPGVRYTQFEADADLVVGGATETIDFSNDDITWAFHSKFDVAENHQLIAAVARGFRAPGIFELTVFGPEDQFFNLPNPDLQAEFLISYELGYRFLTNKTFLALYGYYSDWNDQISNEFTTVNGSPTDPQGRQYRITTNQGSAYIYGSELEFWLNPVSDWVIAGAVSTTYGNDEDDNPLRRIQPITGYLRVRYTTPDRSFFVEPFFRFADKQVRLSGGDIRDSRIGPDGTPGFLTYNVRAGIRPSKYVTLNVAVENISDIDYKYHGSGVYEPGRNFKLGLSLHFDE